RRTPAAAGAAPGRPPPPSRRHPRGRSRRPGWRGPLSFPEDFRMPATLPVRGTSVDPREPYLALLPAIQAHAHAAFCYLRSEHDREDAEAEVVTRAWEQFVAAPVLHATTADRLAAKAVAAVRSSLSRSHG